MEFPFALSPSKGVGNVSRPSGHRSHRAIRIGAQSSIIAFGDGEGGFQTFPIPYAQFAGGDARQLVTGDFNEDGLTDFGVLNIAGCNAICSSASLHIWLSQILVPRAFLEVPQAVEFGPPDGKFAYGIAAGDFNHDGHLDVVFHSGRALAPLGVGEGARQRGRHLSPGADKARRCSLRSRLQAV